MKTNYLFLVFSFAALALASCGIEVDDVLGVQDEQIESKDSIFTYDMYFDSEITSYDGTTRASNASDWEDGDVVYIWFGGNNDAYGQAEYISSSKKWRVSCDKALTEVSSANCSAWYYIGPVSGDVMSTGVQLYNYLTEVYRTPTYGSYTYTNNVIYVNVTMRPISARIRFKGSPGTVIRIEELAHYIGFHRIENYCYYSTNSIMLTVGSNGYTDYFVLKKESTTTSISISNITDGECYSRYFDSNTLKNGESGCYTIPSPTNLLGWTRTTCSYVDLGLPSGTKWATCNIGATKPEEYGFYYAWGETETKDSYTQDNYIYYNNGQVNIGDDIAGTEYDVAHKKWGGSWRMPNEDQIKELCSSCTRSWVNRNGVEGTLITGPNGNTIFLPHAGFYNVNGYYWDSRGANYYRGSTYRYDSYGALGVVLYLTYNVMNWHYNSCIQGFPVRAVCPQSLFFYTIE